MEMAPPWQLPLALRVPRHPNWRDCIFPPLLSNFFLLGPDLLSLGVRITSCWVKESREYERQPLKMKPVRCVIGNTP